MEEFKFIGIPLSIEVIEVGVLTVPIPLSVEVIVGVLALCLSL